MADIVHRLRNTIVNETPARYPDVIEAAIAEIERLRAALRGALEVIESIPRPSAGLVSNHVQAAWDKRVAAIRAALDEQE
jgi:hypothetical protein